MSLSETAPKHVVSAERRAKALDLRKRGLTLEAIATELGVSRQAVHAMVRQELARLNEEAKDSTEEVRRLELERLDLIQSRLMDRALNIDEPDLQDKAVARVDAIMTRRAKLLGLDAPSRVELTLPQLSDALAALQASQAVELLQVLIARAGLPEARREAIAGLLMVPSPEEAP